MALSPKLDWNIANPLWAASLNPLLANPFNHVALLQNIVLKTGSNIINHGLGHMMNGWFLTDVQQSATIYRTAPFNDKTLTLTASAPVTCSIGVF